MTDDQHHHKWTVLKAPDKLQCTSCQTVTDINMLIKNTAAASEKATKIELYVAQLYAKDLRKAAHDKAYAWVVQNSPSILVPVVDNQQELLV